MRIYGLDSLSAQQKAENFAFKLLINQYVAAFFATSLEHRDVTFPGLRYEDDYSGNALAAMVYRSRIELRYHQNFSSGQVAAIIQQLRPKLPTWMVADLVVSYHGKVLKLR